MAVAHRLTLVLVLAARLGRAAPPCEENRGQTGLALAAGPTGIAVVAVDDASAGAAGGLRAGDEVAQVNDVVPRTCADWARAVRAARKQRRALLVLVRRDGAPVPLVVDAAVWSVVVSAPPPPLAAEPPTVRALVATPPPPLPVDVGVSVADVVASLAALTPEDGPPRTLGLEAYRRDLARVHGQVASLDAGGKVAAEVAGGLRTVLDYHDAAVVAWAAEETAGARTPRPRQLPASERVAPYFAESEAEGVLARFPFLVPVRVREPGPNILGGESAGMWRPLAARALLWDHARTELGELRTWLARAEPAP